jgi:hypothetical protein
MTAASSSSYIFPRPRSCAALCGRPAVLKLEIDELCSLELCTDCWKIVDPDGNYIFSLITEEEKEVEN